VTVGDGSQVPGQTDGHVILKEKNSGKNLKISATYCPNFRKNILSVKKLQQGGFMVAFDDEKATICCKKTKEVAFICEKGNDGMFYLRGTRMMEHKVHLAEEESETWKDVTDKIDDKGESIKTTLKAPLKLDINEAHGLWGHKGKALLEKTAKYQNIILTGTLKACEGCGMATASQKAVSKTTNTKAENVCERIFVDGTGPFTTTIAGNRYWYQIVDDYTRYGWCSFKSKKSNLAEWIKIFIEEQHGKGHKIKYIRCDGAGENEEPIKKLCGKHGIIMEQTAPDTPQQNGVVERRIVLSRQRAHAQLLAAGLDDEIRQLLWAASVDMVNTLENITATTKSGQPAYDLMHNESSKLYPYLKEFGRIGIVTIRQKFKTKWKERGIKMIMVGYATDSSADTYRMFNPKTKKIIRSRDVKWLEWKILDPKRDMSIFTKDPTLLEDPVGFDDKEYPAPTTAQPPAPQLIPDDDDSDVEAGRIAGESDTSTPEVREPLNEAAQQAATKATRLEREMRRLESSFNPGTMARQLILDTDDEGKESEKEVHFLFSMATDDDIETPDTIEQAIYGPEKDKWTPSAAGEIMNFISRKCWKKVPRKKAHDLKRKIMKTKWTFLKKDEHDGTKRYKSRCCNKGYEQVPGKDYKESFSPVATDTSIRIGFCIYLMNDDFVAQLIDIEAAFLEGTIAVPTFIDWPDGMEEMGFVSGEDKIEFCIQLLKSMYGNVDAAIRFFKTFKMHLIERMGMTQSLADPCVFYKKNKEGRTILIAICFVDDTLLFGLPEEMIWFKDGISKRFGYKDLGDLKKHLGVWYEEKTDENGEKYIEATMPKKIREIIETYERHIGKEAKIYSVPGTAGICMVKHIGDPVEHAMYRKIVGKIMYVVIKLFPEGANAGRELARHFSNPGPEHWVELGRYVGYMKGIEKDIKLTYRRPKELRALSYVDSNYATDKTDRRSVSGGLHTVGGTLINWMSKTQASVTLSSTEAEYVSLASGATEVKFVQQLLEEIAECNTPGIIMEDNTGAIFLVKNQQVSSRTKHIDVRFHFIREMRERGGVDVLYIRSEKNPSDILTKNTPERTLAIHGKDIRNGTLECRKDWDEIIESIEKIDETINCVQWEDVELRLQEQTEDARRSELVLNTVRDDRSLKAGSDDDHQSQIYVIYVEGD
jgi:hypothetical protein